MSDPSVIIRIDDRLEQYAPMFDHAWADRMEAFAAGTKLTAAVFTLAVHWRAAAGACAMPWLVCHALQPQWQGMLAAQQPFADRLTAVLADRVAEEMGDALSRAKQKRLAEAVERIGHELHAQPEEVTTRFAPATLWAGLLRDPEFQLAVWGAQRLSYGSIYHAYESFLRECIALALDRPDYRGRKLGVLVRDARRLFGPRTAADCLTAPPVTVARLVRNTLAHHGGRETPALRAAGHGLVVEEGVLQILAPDTRLLLEQLQLRAFRLLRHAARLPQLRLP